MTVARRLHNFLKVTNTQYRVHPHASSQSSADSAHAAHVPEANVVKGVLLKNSQTGEYLMALAPASNRLNLSWIDEKTGAALEIAREEELGELFPDCELGAVPGFGQAYNLDMIWDDQLGGAAELYMEAGNHQELIRIDHDDFLQLFSAYPHSSISQPRAK